MGVQAQVDALQGSTRWLLLQVDLRNAFNSITRPAILEAMERVCPSMMPWVRQAFQPAPLLVGREVIWSTRSVQQGDPLGPVLLAAGIQAALDALHQRRALHRWYLDDGVFLGSVADVGDVVGALQQNLPPWGWSSTCVRRRSGGLAWYPRHLPSQPRPAYTWKGAWRCWERRYTARSTTRRWGPTWRR